MPQRVSRRRRTQPPGTTQPAAEQHQQATWRRRRLWLVLIGVSVGWKVLVFTVGAAVPRWLINDGIAQLPAPLQEYGREARITALALWNGPIERHGLVRTVRVMSVHGGTYAAATVGAGSGSADGADGAAPAARAACDGRGAVVRAYTYFGIPYSEVRTTCDRGVVEYRVFRRRKPDAAR